MFKSLKTTSKFLSSLVLFFMLIAKFANKQIEIRFIKIAGFSLYGAKLRSKENFRYGTTPQTQLERFMNTIQEYSPNLLIHTTYCTTVISTP
jgi:hypothetical protein